MADGMEGIFIMEEETITVIDDKERVREIRAAAYAVILVVLNHFGCLGM